MLIGKIERRLKYKKLAKETKDRKYNSLQEMGKLALNGGGYGRLNTKGDWQEDPCCMLKVTMGCQLEILMIVEALILKGFNITSLNTDGWDSIIPRDRESEYKAIISHYEKIIGNDMLGQVEYTEFKWMAQTSVNDYIAQKTESGVNDRGIKKKGDFGTDLKLEQNKSKLIIPIALEKYYVDGIPIAETIKNHKNIYDFCIRQRSSKDFHYEGHSKDGINVYNKLIRYYVSNTGEKVLKIKNPSCQTRAAAVSQVEAGEWLCTVCNYLPKDHPLDNINYNYYIQKAQEIIDKVKLEGRKPAKKQPKEQLNLF